MPRDPRKSVGVAAARSLLLVVSAPSGGGKTTLCHRLLQSFEKMRYSISCTTRPPRGAEVNGRDYLFLPPAEFRQRAARGDFLEHARVHGHWYGTPRSAIEEALRAGCDMLLDIDVQGARLIRSAVAALPAGDDLRRGYVDVFIAPPSLEKLEQRLRDRGQDDQGTIMRRLRNARLEMAAADEYGYHIINDRLEDAIAVLQAVVIAEHHRNPDIKESL